MFTSYFKSYFHDVFHHFVKQLSWWNTQNTLLKNYGLTPPRYATQSDRALPEPENAYRAQDGLVWVALCLLAFRPTLWYAFMSPYFLFNCSSFNFPSSSSFIVKDQGISDYIWQCHKLIPASMAKSCSPPDYAKQA